MGWSESCKRHPGLKRSPGVCPSCLRERLTLLSHSPLFATGPSGYASSGGASPARGSTRYGHQRNASEVNYSVKKSGSVGFVPRCYSHRFGINEFSHEHNNKNNNNNNVNINKIKSNNNYNYYKEKKSSFWSKLISGTRKNKNSSTSLLDLSSRLSTIT